MIEEAAQSNAPSGSDAQKVGDFFQSYVDLERRNALGTKPIEPLLHEISSIQNHRQFATVYAKMLRSGLTGPFGVYVSPDAKKSDQYTVYVSQSGLTLPDRDYYLVDSPQFEKARESLKTYIADMLKVAKHPNPKRASNNLLKLEKSLAILHWDRVKNRDPEATYNKHSMAEFEKLMLGFSLNQFLRDVGLEQQQEYVFASPTT